MTWRVPLAPGLTTLANDALGKVTSRNCLYYYGPNAARGSFSECIDAINWIVRASPWLKICNGSCLACVGTLGSCQVGMAAGFCLRMIV